ncbi:hypothetical protein HDF18_22635 [Mucilaginibacter sp. X5P1]|uniref:hypothetical protein n=1 Tax=Mucilaginibacter sp. X5P1 TaxID=2723088 RepID=UPI0017935D23|nr:hypothetical protein [Mucilaginibacter sp. X5P1]
MGQLLFVMKPIKIELPKGKYISQIEPFKTNGLFSDCIYHKTVTGCGITRYAIEFFNHPLIGILPNVPVIKDKEAKHNKKHPKKNVLGVYKGVEVDDIKAYLLSDVKYKKIITTPEGFIDKVVKAFNDINEMYENYFLLFDECERIITDVNYRGDIAAPIDHFFEFKKKALVSATTLPFSDERFTDFKHYVIEPSYDYSKPIKVIGTNNVISSLNKHIKSLQSDHVCIFINSTNGIYAIAKSLGIESESKAFCAQDSVVKLLIKGYRYASSNFDVKDMVKYNFFTSRYFSAVDMKVHFKPDVIMVTDVFFAEHSIIDPHTEAIQIAGRFRNGINRLVHITNFNPELESKTKEKALDYLHGSFDTYKEFVRSHANSNNPGSRRTLKDAIENSFAHTFFVNEKLNSFMIDNFIHEERVKGYYQSFENLKAAYQEKNKHFKATFEEDPYPVGDKDILELKNARQSKKEKYRIIAGLFDQWTSKFNHFVLPPDVLLDSLIKQYPEIWEAHLTIGLKGLEETGLVMSKIKAAVKKEKEAQQLKILAPKVYETFKVGTRPSEDFILEKLTEIYKSVGVDNINKSDILRFFKGFRSTSKGEHVYVLQEKLFK